MKRNMAKFLFLAPSFLGVVIFVLLPFGDVVKRSFMTAVTKEGAGMRNYQTIFYKQRFFAGGKKYISLYPCLYPAAGGNGACNLLWL